MFPFLSAAVQVSVLIKRDAVLTLGSDICLTHRMDSDDHI